MPRPPFCVPAPGWLRHPVCLILSMVFPGVLMAAFFAPWFALALVPALFVTEMGLLPLLGHPPARSRIAIVVDLCRARVAARSYDSSARRAARS